MKRIVFLVLVLASALWLSACGLIVKPKPSPVVVTKPEMTAEEHSTVTTTIEEESETENEAIDTYSCAFYYDDNCVLKLSDISNNEPIPLPDVDIEPNPEFDIIQVGWDADGDGQPESFPYTVTADTRFDLIYEKAQITYHYDIYINNELVSSADAKYNDTISYPTVESGISGEEVNIFLGWKYDGVFDGMLYPTITKRNLRIDAYFAETQILKLYFDGALYAGYKPSGEALELVNFCNARIADGQVFKVYADSYYTIPFTADTMPTGNLTLYAKIIDTDAPVAEADKVKNREQLLDLFNAMLINRYEEECFTLLFDCEDINELMDYLTDNAIQLYSINTRASLSNHDLTISISYPPMATMKSESVIYTQLPSHNASAYPNTRGEDFDSFAVDKIDDTYYARTSDALYYALEHGYRPIIDDSSTQLKTLYEKMRGVLRMIISDDMSDIDKARAIYEYLIMNTVYDAHILNLMRSSNTQELSAYNSFYLEGVFNDNLAVCDGMAKAFASLCAIEGIRCVRITGVTVDGINHAWNKIMIDNVWYIIDVTSGGSITKEREVLTYAYFMITDEQYSARAVADGICYDGPACVTKFNIYDCLEMNGKSLSADSVDEAGQLMKDYIENAPSGISTFDFMLNFNYDKKNIGKVVSDILRHAGISANIKYITTFDSLTVIYEK